MKYIQINIFFLMFCSIILVGCDSFSNNNPMFLKIEIDINKTSKMTLTDWFDDIELIPLQTSDQSLIGGSNKIIQFDGKYYVLDSKQHTILVFDAKGDFLLSSSNNKGEGPDQYLSLTDFDIDISTGNIHLLDPVSNKIRIFNIFLNPIEKIELAKDLLPLSRFKLVKEGYYVFYNKGSSKEQESLKIYSVEKGEVIRRLMKVRHEYAYMPTVGHRPFYSYNGEIYFSDQFPNNDLYILDNESFDLEKVLEYGFGKATFKIEEQLNENENRDYYSYFMPNNKHLVFVIDKIENDIFNFVSVNYGNNIYVIRSDKKNRQKLELIENRAFQKGWLYPPIFLDNTFYYTVVQPPEIGYVIDERLLSALDKGKLGKIKEDDNPIIVKYRFKKK